MPIRFRLALVFTAAAAVLFALGSWLLISVLSSSLLSAIDAQLATRLSSAGQYLARPVGSPAGTGGTAPGDYVVQVIDPAGRVRGSSQDADEGQILPPASRRQAARHRLTITTAEEDERQRVMAGPLRGHRGWVAVAAVSLESYDATISQVTRGLVIGGVVITLAAGLGAYRLARAALSPVERMRRQVAALSERDEAPGVAVPRTRDEIAALAETMNELLARLNRALGRQRALVADASHELRTPLAVLSGELELAARPGRSQAELQEAVARAADEAARLARLTAQLLFLARADEDQAAPQRQRTDIAALLCRSAELASLRSRDGVTCDVRVPAGLAAQIDPDQVREAVDNLVGNALRYAPAGSAIGVSAAARDGALTIEVADRGPGFPPEFLPRAFERFARPDSGRARADGGAGLGLAIVQAIAQAHGGQATAQNRSGGGAVVSVELPGACSPPG
jgi:signal transduction histidine kinase